MTLQDIEKNVATRVRSIVPRGVRRIFLFGSRATRTNQNPRADIDIGLIADEPLPLHQMARLREAIEEIPTLLKIDIVDFTGRNDAFTTVATQYIHTIYESPKSDPTTA